MALATSCSFVMASIQFNAAARPPTSPFRLRGGLFGPNAVGGRQPGANVPFVVRSIGNGSPGFGEVLVPSVVPRVF